MDEETQALMTSDSAKALELIYGRDEDLVNAGPVKREKQRAIKYWRKPDHYGATDAGWIMTGPDYMTDAAGHARYKEKGRKELPDSFGREITHQPGTKIAWEATKLQVKKPETWLEPFIKGGGLTYIIKDQDDYGKPGTYLFPATQLVALGMHRRPGIDQVRPDLADATDVECPNEGCIQESNGERRRFAGVNKAAAERALDSHMASHKGGEGARSAGREVQKALEAMAAQNGSNQLDAEKIAAIVASTIMALQQSNVVQVSTPEAKKYPDGKPDATWKRPQLMAWASANGVKYPPGGTKNTTEQWFEYLQKKGVTAA